MATPLARHGPTILRVKGIPGSGKTYLCNELRKHGVMCLDTDDLVTMAYESLRKTVEFRFAAQNYGDGDDLDSVPRLAVDMIEERAQELMREVIRMSNASLVVVAGILMNVPGHETYFVEMDDHGIHQAYDRVMCRELDKIRRHVRPPFGHMSGLDAKFLHHVGALPMDMTLSGYKQVYERANAEAVAQGSCCLSATSIREDILMRTEVTDNEREMGGKKR